MNLGFHIGMRIKYIDNSINTDKAAMIFHRKREEMIFVKSQNALKDTKIK